MKPLSTPRILPIVLAACLLAAALCLPSCAVNPVTGEKELMLLSRSEEKALGERTDEQIVSTYGVYDDPELEGYVRRIGQDLVPHSHRSGLDHTFRVLDSPAVNAFAVPGGYVYLTREILAYMNSEAELAGVLGHEIGHISARHTAQQYSRAQLAQLGLGLGSILSEAFRDYAELARFGVGLLFLRYSRDDERQADDLGVEYATRAGYDAAEMAGFFETLRRKGEDSGAGSLPGWLSTHPDPADRQGAVREKAQTWKRQTGKAPYRVRREAYLREIDGIVVGEDPRQGYVEKGRFYHPEMKFSFPVPDGWKVENAASRVRMIEPNQQAVILFFAPAASSARTAARDFFSESGANVLSSEAVQVSGLDAQRVIASWYTDRGELKGMVLFIEKGGSVFGFQGLAPAAAFDGYQGVFRNTMTGFRALDDPDRLRRGPSRLRVRTVAASGDLRSALSSLGVSGEELAFHALLNGMYLEDRVEAGSKLKVVSR